MKKLTLKLFLSLFLISGIGSFLQAQQHLNAIMENCETRDDIRINVVKSKGEKIISVSFSGNEKLEKEIIDAFRKDREAAVKIIEDKNKGKVDNLFYTFFDPNNITESSYIYDRSKSGKIEFTLIEKSHKR